MSRRLNKFLTYLIPGCFGSLVFFCLPGAAGGYRVVKWACAGFLLFCLASFLFRRLACLRLPANKIFLIAAIAFPLSFAFSLFTVGTDTAISLVGIMRYCIGFAFFLLTGSLWSSFEQRQKETTLFYLLVIAALSTIPLMISFYGVCQKARIFEPDITGTFGNPNWAAEYFTTALPVALYFLFTASGNFKRWLAALSLVMLAAGIAVSLSKTAVAAGMVVLGAGLFVFYQNRLFKKYLLGAISLASLLFLFYFHQTILAWLEPRLFIWKALVTAMRDTWLVGNGALQALRNFEAGAAQLLGGDMTLYMPSSQVDFVHNDYLQALAEGGIIGLMSLLTLIVCTLAKAYRSENRVVQAAGLSLLALCVNGCGDSPLQVPVTFFFWWLLAGVIWFDGTGADGFAVRNPRVIKSIIILLLVLFSVEGGRQSLGSYFWTKSGGTTTLVQQKKCLKQAAFFLPEAGNLQTEYAQALSRSRRYREARAQALRAKAVKFDYDDLYVITEADIALKVIDPVPAWKDIADRFPCLNYPRIKLAEFYLRNRDYQLALDECNVIIGNNCETVNPGQPYAEQAARIVEMIANAENK